MLIHDYVTVSDAFVNIWEPLDRGHSMRVAGSGLTSGALGHQMRTAEHAVQSLRNFVRWFSVGMARFRVMEGYVEWMRGHKDTAFEKWAQGLGEARKATGPNS